MVNASTKKKARRDEKGGLALAGEALCILRAAPIHVTFRYFIGALPFVLGFLFFFSDMSRSAFAKDHCFEASFGLVVLFIWMKCWHATFASGLMSFVTGEHTTWSLRRIIRMILHQAIIQPLGLVVIPLSMLIMIPFPTAYAFYQNITCLGDGTATTRHDLTSRSFKLANLWPRQNITLIWLLCPWNLAIMLGLIFGVFQLMTGMLESADMPQNALLSIALFQILYILVTLVVPLCPIALITAVNVAATLALMPFLAKMLFGIDTAFTVGGSYAFSNTTFMTTVFALSYLCLDPLIKASYVLRCFYGQSRRNGSDLLTELRMHSHAGSRES